MNTTRKKAKAEIYKSSAPEKTIQAGRRFSREIKPGTVIALIGDLGSGKTTFVKGVALGLGVSDKREVKSPTFVIFHLYKGRVPLYHFDLYRLEQSSDLIELGMDEYLGDSEAVSLIEWADRLPGVLEQADVQVRFLRNGEKKRTLEIVWRE